MQFWKFLFKGTWWDLLSLNAVCEPLLWENLPIPRGFVERAEENMECPNMHANCQIGKT